MERNWGSDHYDNLGKNYSYYSRKKKNNNNIGIEKAIIEGCDSLSKHAMTMNGCNDLRRLLMGDENLNLGMKETMINKVIPDVPLLMVHHIGYQFVKTVFDCCNQQQITNVLQSLLLSSHPFPFFYISNHHYGKEAMKWLIKNLKSEEQLIAVTNVLTNHICRFTNFYNAQQVLEFFIVTCNDDFTKKFIFNAMTTNIVNIATNQSGCVILQRCINPTFIGADFVSLLLKSIIINSPMLANDKYGNYVVQHVIGSDIEDVIEHIVEQLEGKFSDLAKSKFGSNVVEKCLEIGQENEVTKIITELANSVDLLTIAQGPFGNYVIQSALERAHSKGMEALYHKLVKGVNIHSSILQTHLYGRTVMSKIHKLNVASTYRNAKMKDSSSFANLIM